MKVAIIQLSDIHLRGTRDFIFSKQEKMFAAIKSTLLMCQKVIVIISGDIANTGIKKEYDAAKSFLSALETKIKENTPINNVDYIFVPGNHDCFLPEESDPIRDAVIFAEANKDTLEKQALINCLTQPQKDYWDFYRSYYSEKDPSEYVSCKKQSKLMITFLWNFTYTTQVFYQQEVKSLVL